MLLPSLKIILTSESTTTQSATITTITLALSTDTNSLELVFAPTTRLAQGECEINFSLPSSAIYDPPLAGNGNYILYSIQQPYSSVKVNVLGEELTTEQIKTIENGKIVASIISPDFGRSYPDFTEIILWASNADPTGLFTQFTQVLKLLNILYFINIDYGKTAELFFQQIGKSGASRKQGSDDKEAIQRNWRGKLSRKDVLGNYARVYYIRIIIYLSMWLLKAVTRILIDFEVRIPKYMLVCVYYLPRVHLIVFNSVLMDLLFYGTRSLLQFELPLWNYFVSSLCFVLVTIDIISMVNGTIFKQAIMQNNLRRTKVNIRLTRVIPVENDEGVPSERELSKKGSFKKAYTHTNAKERNWPFCNIFRCKKSESAQNLQIDYKSTYRNIDITNTHLLRFLTQPLSKNLQLASSKVFSLVILIIPFRYIRILCYNVLIVSTQLVPSVCLASLIIMELITIATFSIVHWKYKGFKSTMVYLVDTFPSLVLLAFLICSTITLASSPPSSNLQNMTIYSYISAVVAEYLRIFLLLSSLLYKFIIQKIIRRQNNNKTTKIPFLWFIRYVEIKSTTPQEGIFIENNSANLLVKINKIKENSNTKKILELNSPRRIISKKPSFQSINSFTGGEIIPSIRIRNISILSDKGKDNSIQNI